MSHELFGQMCIAKKQKRIGCRAVSVQTMPIVPTFTCQSGCRMSLKLYALHAHIDEFKDYIGDNSEEQSERFHQEVRSFDESFKGQYNESIMRTRPTYETFYAKVKLTYGHQSRKHISFQFP